jgi:hypothetical protein
MFAWLRRRGRNPDRPAAIDKGVARDPSGKV